MQQHDAIHAERVITSVITRTEAETIVTTEQKGILGEQRQESQLPIRKVFAEPNEEVRVFSVYVLHERKVGE